jgi:Putative threonine efflux protein
MFNIASFFVFITLMAFTPGPNNIMSMGNALRFGFRRSFPFNLGIWAGFSFVMLLCALAGAALASLIPSVTVAMKVAGAAYMFVLAWQTFRASGSHGERKEGRPSFGAGAFLQLVNPKIYIYGFTAMSSWILPNFRNPAIVAAFALFLALYGFVATVTWALFGSVFSRFFSGTSRMLNAVLALLLVWCAVSLFL